MTNPNITAVQFKAPEGAEVSGIILLAYLNNLESTVTEPILAEYGFEADKMDAEKWYPNQMFLDIEKTIFDAAGGQNALVAIGKSAAENYIPPAGVKTLEDAIESLPDVYTSNQRNLPEGYGWLIEKVAENHYVFTNNTGTTNHGAYGYVWALCNKMNKGYKHLRVIPRNGFIDESTEPTIIDITWDLPQ